MGQSGGVRYFGGERPTFNGFFPLTKWFASWGLEWRDVGGFLPCAFSVGPLILFLIINRSRVEIMVIGRAGGKLDI